MLTIVYLIYLYKQIKYNRLKKNIVNTVTCKYIYDLTGVTFAKS